MSKARTIAVPKSPQPRVEAYVIGMQLVRESTNLRLDASHYNPRLAQAIAALRHSGLNLKPLGDPEITERIFMPPRFKRIYVEKEYGLPFLQGSHVVHFQPADLKYLSKQAHEGIERWIIEEGWVLVTRSGTIGRVTIVPKSWHGWAASEDILRIVPKIDGPCPVGYICAYLSSSIGQMQLTSQIYGAVIDHLTEDQTCSILIPVPKTVEEVKAVEGINKAALAAIEMKEAAVRLAGSSVISIEELLMHPDDAGQKETGGAGQT